MLHHVDLSPKTATSCEIGILVALLAPLYHLLMKCYQSVDAGMAIIIQPRFENCSSLDIHCLR